MSAIVADVLVALGERRAFGRDVGIVEAEERHIEQVEQLEGDVGLELGAFHALVVPGAIEGAAAERVAAFPGEGVPVGDGGADVVLHPLAEDHLVLVVVAIGQRVLGARALELDGLNALEEIGHLTGLLDGGIERAIARVLVGIGLPQRRVGRDDLS